MFIFCSTECKCTIEVECIIHCMKELKNTANILEISSRFPAKILTYISICLQILKSWIIIVYFLVLKFCFIWMSIHVYACTYRMKWIKSRLLFCNLYELQILLQSFCVCMCILSIIDNLKIYFINKPTKITVTKLYSNNQIVSNQSKKKFQ